jgi:hypothetical protein
MREIVGTIKERSGFWSIQKSARAGFFLCIEKSIQGRDGWRFIIVIGQRERQAISRTRAGGILVDAAS